MSKLNIAVFFGSRSCEHDVSIISAMQLIEAAKAAGFFVTPVYISREGLWYTGDALCEIETFRNFNPMAQGITRVTLDVSAGSGDLWAWPPQRAGLFAKVPAPVAHIDCAIPVLHGLHGEDGTLQGLFEMANLPYASSGVLGSSVGMDKIAMKLLLRGAGYPVLDFVWMTRDQLKTQKEELIARIEKEIKYPAFVKPAALGSSIGVSRASNREELERACKLDFWRQYDDTCIACGTCNTVCPTCSCFDTVDIIYHETSSDGERRRVWSACMLADFTETAGGSRARKTQGDNMRFKVLHKVYDYQLRFGGEGQMCVGCGRCIDRCPREIDYLDAVNGLTAALSGREEG